MGDIKSKENKLIQDERIEKGLDCFFFFLFPLPLVLPYSQYAMLLEGSGFSKT